MLTHSTKRLGCTALVGLAAALAPGAASAAPPPQPQPGLPTEVRVEAGHTPYLAGHATGVQIYRCNAPGSWGLVAPRADLVDAKGKVIVTHFGGPSWQARDGSTVVAKRVNGATVDPTAIPWLLLAADPAKTTPGADGDKLVKTTFIQRINTVGGLAPVASTCTAENAGAVQEIPYEADYVFWKKA
ncbi:MAG TPA: DUF3455 domain-containing protein [Solirubrobacteraceae bacterium]|jgi:FtsP/CotA-like multicopper oxidase with cupredoxin domain